MTMPQPLALALGEEIYSRGFRFSPTPHEAVTYYLPRLTSGEPLHSVVRPVIHHADVHACEPAELARRFRPMPRTGDRFFFSPCKKKKAAAASPVGCWTAQSTAEIKDDGKGKGGGGGVIGELRKLRYKKRGVFTDWLMDEYSSPACGGGDKQQKQEFVFCKVYVSPRASPTSAARHESAAFFSAPPPPQLPPPSATRPTPAAGITHLMAKRTTAPPPPPTQQAAMPLCTKRTAPPTPQGAVPPCAKRMRLGPVLEQQPAPPAALTTPPLAAVRKMCFAPPPQPCRGSPAVPFVTQTRPSPAPAPIQSSPAPPVPRLPIRPVVQPRCSPMPAPPRPLAQPKQQVPLPTPAMARACQVPRQTLAPAPCQPPQVSVVQSKQRRSVLDPFEAAVREQEAEEQTVSAAAPDPPPPQSEQLFPAADAAAAPVLQDDDDDDLVKALEEAMSTDEAEEQTGEEEEEDCWDDLEKELEIQIQDEDEDQDCWDDLAKELELVEN